MSMIAANYAQALYDLACEEALEVQLLSELQVLAKVFTAEPEYLRLLASPTLSKEERCAVVDSTLSGKAHPYVCNLLKLMTEKGTVRCFCDCCKQYQSLYDASHGIIAVRAVTAAELTQEQLSRLRDKLVAVTGKAVRIEHRVDPACLGGIRLDYDGKRVDGTVQTRLKNLGELLKNTVL